MDYFDDFSWRELVAMVWPAASGHRGVADTSKKVADPGPRVFETFKSLYELFHDDGSAPSAYNKYDSAQMNVCKATARFGDLVLGSKVRHRGYRANCWCRRTDRAACCAERPVCSAADAL